jgi:hypothetical protein
MKVASDAPGHAGEQGGNDIIATDLCGCIVLTPQSAGDVTLDEEHVELPKITLRVASAQENGHGTERVSPTEPPSATAKAEGRSEGTGSTGWNERDHERYVVTEDGRGAGRRGHLTRSSPDAASRRKRAMQGVRQPRRGERPRKERPSVICTRWPKVRTHPRSKASRDRIPPIRQELMALETATAASVADR